MIIKLAAHWFFSVCSKKNCHWFFLNSDTWEKLKNSTKIMMIFNQIFNSFEHQNFMKTWDFEFPDFMSVAMSDKNQILLFNFQIIWAFKSEKIKKLNFSLSQNLYESNEIFPMKIKIFFNVFKSSKQPNLKNQVWWKLKTFFSKSEIIWVAKTLKIILNEKFEQFHHSTLGSLIPRK